MLSRIKLLSAASALTMAMAVGAAYADELTAEQLDTVYAGAAAAAATSSFDTAAAVASQATAGTSSVISIPSGLAIVVSNPGAGAFAGAP